MLIIGAGECGARAALALRDGGYDGAVTLVGQEPHLPYERPPLSKDAMVAEAEPSPKLVGDRQFFADRRIDCVTATRATAIDRAARTVALADGRALSFDKLLLTTGATPRLLPLPGADGSRCAYLRTHDDALRIRGALKSGSHVVILGGGFIGLELAASARKRGARVTVIEALARILTRGVPEEIARVIEARHRSEGVALACGKGVTAVRESESGIEIALSDGSSIVADLFIIGIGAVPVTDLARQAGLAIENGIAVDEQLRTSDAGHLCGGRLLLVSIGHLWRTARAARMLAQRAGSGRARRAQHAGRRRDRDRGALVLVGSV